MTDLRAILAPYAGFGLGLLLTGLGLREWLQGMRTRAWPSTRGTITTSRLDEGPRDRWFIKQYRAVISYAFHAAGKEWAGDRITVSSDARDLNYRRSAQARVDRYSIGAKVDVYFDPSDPSKSVLKRGVPPRVLFVLLLGPCFLALGAWLFSSRASR